MGDEARHRPNEQRVIASGSEDRTLLRIVDIGSSPTNPTSEKSLVNQGFFRFFGSVGIGEGKSTSSGRCHDDFRKALCHQEFRVI